MPAGTVLGVLSGHQIGRRVVVAYAGATLLGASGLALLPSTESGGMTIVDAVFTATSALTLTGLSVVPAEELTLVGEVLLFALIALGAVGVAATIAGLALLIGRRSWTSRRKIALDVSMSADQQRRFLVFVLLTVLTATVTGGLALRVLGLGWWDSAFQALSGFANAGFSTYGDSLASVSAPAVAVIALLVVFGGLGYPVTFDLLQSRRTTKQLSATTRITLKASLSLLLLGFCLYGALEWTRPESLGPMPLTEKIAALLSLAVMPRSAGFSAFPTGDLSEGSLLLSIVLMFVGAGPAATAGGIKVTGFTVLLIASVAALRGREDAHTARIGMSQRTVNHAVAVAISLLVTILVLAVALAHRLDVGAALFNATSAVTTTGLSVGDAATLGWEKLLLSLGMLIGRLAPMLLTVRLNEGRVAPVRPANQDILIT